MSRKGPEYVASETELFADLDRKRDGGEITEATAEAFVRLYEFAERLADSVDIGEAKNANFQANVNAHQGDYPGDPSVFTANVSGAVKIWPARMPMDNEPGIESVPWDEADYRKLERSFRSLDGVSKETTVTFETLASSGDLEEFETIVETFVETCRERASESV